MAYPPSSSDRRANLIREMARQSDRSRSRGSGASSGGSDRASIPDFDTDSQQLPALPPPNPHQPAKQSHEPEYQINTSALKRAFPDFSRDGSLEEDSIEFGRGADNDHTLSSDGTSEDLSMDLGAAGKFRVTGTPPLKPKNKKSFAENAAKNATSKRLTSEKENQDPLKARNRSVENQNSHNTRPDLAHLHANVESENSVSINRDFSLAKRKAKNTRFAKMDNRQPLGESQSAANIKPTDQGNQDATLTSVNSANKGTYQSFVLPDLPNITELVSGVRQDGTPLFSRSAKSRSRIGTPSTLRQQRESRARHVPINEVSVPADERALILSLQILQEKVKSLETAKAQSDKKAEDYELEVLQLKSKLEESENVRHSDSGIGFDAEEERTKEWESEKSRFEVSVKSLEKRLDRATKKVSTSENEIRSLKHDRDAAQQQLAIAYINSEELEKEDEGVRDDLEKIRSQLTKVTQQHERRVEKLTGREFELRQKIQRREKAVKEMSALAKELWDTRNAIASFKKADQTVTAPSTNKTGASKRKEGISRRPARPVSVGDGETHQRSRLHETTGQRSKKDKPRPASTTVASVANDTYDSDANSTTHLDLSGIQGYEFSKDASYLSFMEGDEVAKLKKVLEQDKAHLAKYGSKQTAQEGPRRAGPAKVAVPRKSSLKDLSTRSKRAHVQSQDQDISKQVMIDDSNIPRYANSRSQVIRDDNPLSTEFRIDGSEKDDTRQTNTSQKPDRKRRRSGQDHTENMTSALILPDITLSDAGLNGQVQVEADDNDTPVPLENAERSKAHATVTRPTPVSSRPPPSDVEDPTLRPAQSPAVALATVLHMLQSELAELRKQLAHQEELYRQHDPALSKRKRQVVYARMQKLLTQIELRSDQIYALYDVLEGQKQKGMEMPEEKIEVTLQKFGLSTVAGTTGEKTKDIEKAETNVKENARRDVNGNQDDEDESSGSEEDGDEDGLDAPWEGFENTGTQTLEGLRAMGARAAA